MNELMELRQLAQQIDNQEAILLYNKVDKEIERLNNIIENLTTMTVNGDRTQIKNTAQYKIDKAIEYIESYINQFNGVYPIVDMRYLDLHKLLDILKGENNE